MPLFKQRRASESTGSDVSDQNARAAAAPPPTTTANDTPTRKGSLFSSNRNAGPAASNTATSPAVNNHTAVDDTASTRSHSLFRGFGAGGNKTTGRRVVDPSILAAREKVQVAEEREKHADEALVAARAAVVEARDHARRLEEEAAEDARLAQMKVEDAHVITKSTRGLGRHGPKN